jgi:hypothetical protein
LSMASPGEITEREITETEISTLDESSTTWASVH